MFEHTGPLKCLLKIFIHVWLWVKSCWCSLYFLCLFSSVNWMKKPKFTLFFVYSFFILFKIKHYKFQMLCWEAVWMVILPNLPQLFAPNKNQGMVMDPNKQTSQTECSKERLPLSDTLGTSFLLCSALPHWPTSSIVVGVKQWGKWFHNHTQYLGVIQHDCC